MIVYNAFGILFLKPNGPYLVNTFSTTYKDSYLCAKGRMYVFTAEELERLKSVISFKTFKAPKHCWVTDKVSVRY